MRIRLAVGIVITLCCLAAAPVSAIDGGRYGNVKAVQPPKSARGFVILFSNRDGLTITQDAAATAVANSGALVVEVDTPAYLSRLDSRREQCHELVGDVDLISRIIQRKHHFNKYLTPILAGIGEGGTVAEMALAQAPTATIAGVVAVNPTAIVGSLHPICSELSPVRGTGGFRYAPPKTLQGFWVVGLTPAVPPEDRDYIMSTRGSGLPVEVHELAAAGTADALRTLIQPHLAKPNLTKVTALPLSELPVEHPSKVMAVVLSGDGGWRDLDKTIAEDLQRHGIPVVGWDSLRYFWRKKTPEQTARDLASVLDTFMVKWHTSEVALIGYSFGADVLPFTYNRLPEGLRSHVALISLLGFAKSADFQIDVYGWLGLPPGPDALSVTPELAKMPPALVQCFYGQNEADTVCPALASRGIEVIRTGGGHHFGGNYDALADRILARLKQYADRRS